MKKVSFDGANRDGNAVSQAIMLSLSVARGLLSEEQDITTTTPVTVRHDIFFCNNTMYYLFFEPAN